MKILILGLAAAAAFATSLPVAAQPVDRREQRQEQRIQQGEQSGALTPREATHLQRREVRLHRTEARMRSRNGGQLSHHQRVRLSRMENRDSRAIAGLKHNDRRF